jgi:hypothetical protein
VLRLHKNSFFKIFFFFILAQFQFSTHAISFLLFSSVVARTTGDHGMNNKSDVTHGESEESDNLLPLLF